jgi:hypothetical protein
MKLFGNNKKSSSNPKHARQQQSKENAELLAKGKKQTGNKANKAKKTGPFGR